MAKSHVAIKGHKRIISNLKRLQRKYPHRVRAAMTEIVANIAKESMKRTPIRTGDLMGSHRTAVTSLGGTIFGTIFLTKIYALFVHEARESTKFRSPWPRGRKFLERAINENLDKILGTIRKWLV